MARIPAGQNMIDLEPECVGYLLALALTSIVTRSPEPEAQLLRRETKARAGSGSLIPMMMMMMINSKDDQLNSICLPANENEESLPHCRRKSRLCYLT